eukprot:gb/GEZN01006053.1/.p1 GENE.gb/GEZN01006053.1/~~gb/GEZN01006053.1/.p1  ORF type:complete len:505 (-),score=79.60 gb/GEZN01006053.1/:172-1686(-)
MHPRHKKQKAATLDLMHARSLDDNDEQPLSFSSSSSRSSSLLSLASTVDSVKSDICRRFLALSKEVGSLPEGSYIPEHGSSEVFDVRHNAADGGKEGETMVEVTRRTETIPDLEAVTTRAHHDIESEIAKRRQDIRDLDQTILSLEGQIEMGGAGVAKLVEELGEVLQVKGNHKRCIKNLSSTREMELRVDVVRSCVRVEVRVSVASDSTSSERRVVCLEQPCLWNLGGWLCGLCTSSVEWFDRNSKSWKPMVSMVHKRCMFAAVLLNREVFVMGGSGLRNLTLSSVEKYDPVQKSWSLVAPMTTKRERFAAVVLDGQIYAIGGCGPLSLSSVEKYNVSIDTWQEVAPMNHKRTHCVAAVLEGNIYVMGGWDENHDYLVSVERFDVLSNSWELIAPMKTLSHNASAVVLNGRIYVLDDKTMQRFDAREGKWELVTSPSCHRSSFAAAVLDGQIYVTGGTTPAETVVLTVDKYDETKNVWEVVDDARMYGARQFHTSVVAFPPGA